MSTPRLEVRLVCRDHGQHSERLLGVGWLDEDGVARVELLRTRRELGSRVWVGPSPEVDLVPAATSGKWAAFAAEAATHRPAHERVPSPAPLRLACPKCGLDWRRSAGDAHELLVTALEHRLRVVDVSLLGGYPPR